MFGGSMSLHKDAISGIVLLILCILGAISVSQIPDPDANEIVGPATLPKISLIALAVCGIIQIARGMRKGSKTDGASYGFCWKSIAFYGFYLMYMIAMVLIGDFIIEKNFVKYIPYAGGFVISTILFLIASFYMLGRKKPVEIICVTLITTAVLAISFGGFFKIILP